MWLVNCNIIDVATGERREETNLRIEGHRIVELARRAPVDGSDVIDLDGRHLLPGLISCHTHFSEVYPFSSSDPNESPAITVLRSLAGARQALQAGVTTVRCLHELNRADIWLRTAHASGWIEIPRIRAAARAISTTGGHGDIGLGCAIADGPAEFMKAAREELRAGADHIKVFISGGIAEATENLDAVQMSGDELRAVVAAASQRDRYVVAHSANSKSIKIALEAGVRSFEHAYELNDETAGLLRDMDAYLTPTLCVTQCRDWMKGRGFEESQVARAAEVAPSHMSSIERAIRNGVTLVNGTDGSPGEPIDGTSMAVVEAELMVGAGLTPTQSLRAATLNAAELLGIADHVGQVREEMEADLVAVRKDPVSSIQALRTIDFVMGSGKVVRHDF